MFLLPAETFVGCYMSTSSVLITNDVIVCVGELVTAFVISTGEVDV